METLPHSGSQQVSIIEKVRNLASSPFSNEVNRRSEEFLEFRKASGEQIFGELCFCLLTANTSAEMGVRTQKAIGLEGFLHLDQPSLRNALRDSKYRFYNLRSRFIVDSRWIVDELPDLINSGNPFNAREYLVENIKGIGYKEASHFLRNVGVFDFAILDKHILKMLLSEKPDLNIRVATRKNYLETEQVILGMARDMGLEPGILDLYMWKIATGKLIK
jgi:N-glycosylase/DNA lyase